MSRPCLHRYPKFCSPSGSSLSPPNVFPRGLETNMAAFVYFLIGMPASWIMSATAAAPGHSLHKQQLEKQNLGHCLGDFPLGLQKQGWGRELCAKRKSDTQSLPLTAPHLNSINDSQDGLYEHRCRNVSETLLPRTLPSNFQSIRLWKEASGLMSQESACPDGWSPGDRDCVCV